MISAARTVAGEVVRTVLAPSLLRVASTVAAIAAAASTAPINAFRLSVNRTVIGRPGVKFFSPGDVGVKAFSYAEGAMVLNITGGFQFSTRTVYAHNVTDSYQINDDVNLVRGNHQLTFGANLSNFRIYQRCLVSGQGSYVFNGTATGIGMGDFLTGKLTSLMQVTPILWSSRQNYIAAYLQDVWKMSPKLTLNSGLRWEPFLPLSIGCGQGPTLNEGVSFNFSDTRTRGITPRPSRSISAP